MQELKTRHIHSALSIVHTAYESASICGAFTAFIMCSIAFFGGMSPRPYISSISGASSNYCHRREAEVCCRLGTQGKAVAGEDTGDGSECQIAFAENLKQS